MATIQPHLAHIEVISLLSDTEDDGDDFAQTAGLAEDLEPHPALATVHVTTPTAYLDWPEDADQTRAHDHDEYHDTAGELAIVPYEGSDPGPSVEAATHVGPSPPVPTTKEVHGAEDCLRRILEIFPDINHDHVHALYNTFDNGEDYECLPPPARLDYILEQLVSAKSYPKQPRQDKGKKRKRDDSPEPESWRQWLRPDRPFAPNLYKQNIHDILQCEFSDDRLNPLRIRIVIMEKHHLFQTYVELAKVQDLKGVQQDARVRDAHAAAAEALAADCGGQTMIDELRSARRYVEHLREERYMQNVIKRREEDNLRIATEAGDIAECQACFDTYPMNRQIHCDGPSAHFTCFECAETYVKAQVGQSTCKVVCTAGCGAPFAPRQLNLLPNKDLIAKFADLEQQEAVRNAGLEDLEECCFCEYKAIMPPVDQNFLFECSNPDCSRISCRRCRKEAHTPLSCEEAANDTKLDSRHKIEEAMTAALVRSCNKCKTQFVKDFGCNKMTCPKCRNTQCYVCSQNVTNYNHFEQGRGSQGSSNCLLVDNLEERHEREVREAEIAARQKVLDENPGISQQDVEIKMAATVQASPAHPGAIHAAREARPREIRLQQIRVQAMRLQQIRQQEMRLLDTRRRHEMQELRQPEARLHRLRAEFELLRGARRGPPHLQAPGNQNPWNPHVGGQHQDRELEYRAQGTHDRARLERALQGVLALDPPAAYGERAHPPGLFYAGGVPPAAVQNNRHHV